MAKNYVDSLLGEREKILSVSRQHWFTLVSAIFIEIVIFFVVLAVVITLSILFPATSLIIVLIGLIVILIPLVTMVMDILNWINRQYIITNRRVVQVSGVVNKNVIDSSLEKVNDIMMVQSVFGRIFNYGDVEILTASEMGANKFRRIAKPIEFKTTLLNAKEKLERNDDPDSKGVDEGAQIVDLITKLDTLRDQGVISEEEFNQKKNELLAKM